MYRGYEIKRIRSDRYEIWQANELVTVAGSWKQAVHTIDGYHWAW